MNTLSAFTVTVGNSEPRPLNEIVNTDHWFCDGSRLWKGSVKYPPDNVNCVINRRPAGLPDDITLEECLMRFGAAYGADTRTAAAIFERGVDAYMEERRAEPPKEIADEVLKPILRQRDLVRSVAPVVTTSAAGFKAQRMHDLVIQPPQSGSVIAQERKLRTVHVFSCPATRGLMNPIDSNEPIIRNPTVQLHATLKIPHDSAQSDIQVITVH